MKKEKSLEMVSLNSELPQLYVEELEKRLETDPLLIGGLLDASSSDALMDGCSGFDCTDFKCGWF